TAIGLVDDRQAGAVGVEPGAVLDEGLFGHAEKGGDRGGFGGGDVDVAGPAAAVAAAHALEARRGSVKRGGGIHANFRSRARRAACSYVAACFVSCNEWMTTPRATRRAVRRHRGCR